MPMTWQTPTDGADTTFLDRHLMVGRTRHNHRWGLRRYQNHRRIRLVHNMLASVRPHPCLLKCSTVCPRLSILN